LKTRPVLHHELHLLQRVHVVERIAGTAMRSAKNPALIGPRVWSVTLTL
jgi:hypothetical protein